jgi:nucleotide-binding universal stress UspA family protein
MTIVVPIGDRSLSLRALDAAIELAKVLNTDIVAVHSLYGGEKTDVEDIRRGEELLDEAIKRVEEKGLRAIKRLLIRGRHPGEDIVDLAEEVDARMIVMGCGLIEAGNDVLLGGVTEYVIINSRKPVLLVK